MARTNLEIANVSDTGQKRPHNEDSAATEINGDQDNDAASLAGAGLHIHG